MCVYIYIYLHIVILIFLTGLWGLDSDGGFMWHLGAVRALIRVSKLVANSLAQKRRPSSWSTWMLSCPSRSTYHAHAACIPSARAPYNWPTLSIHVFEDQSYSPGLRQQVSAVLLPPGPGKGRLHYVDAGSDDPCRSFRGVELNGVQDDRTQTCYIYHTLLDYTMSGSGSALLASPPV